MASARQVLPNTRSKHSLDWYYHEALRRKRYDFLEKFPPTEEHINRFDIIFAADSKKNGVQHEKVFDHDNHFDRSTGDKL